jgi:hypothetical protein
MLVAALRQIDDELTDPRAPAMDPARLQEPIFGASGTHFERAPAPRSAPAFIHQYHSLDVVRLGVREGGVMGFKFKKFYENWVALRSIYNLGPLDELDLHFGSRLGIDFLQAMDQNERATERAVIEAYEQQRPYLLIRHGWSTSRPGRTTARSVVRGWMRSKAATRYIDRSGCIEHEAAFLVKLQPLR